jgi:hypothetical protein
MLETVIIIILIIRGDKIEKVMEEERTKTLMMVSKGFRNWMFDDNF